MGQITNSSERRGRKSIRLDMTPMVDLAFLLLTFFVLTMTINSKKAMTIAMPDTDPGEPPPVTANRVITLLLDASDKIHYYNGLDIDQMADTDYSSDGLHELLVKKKNDVENAIVIVKPTSRSRYKNLVDALDEIRIAEIGHYYITKETNQERVSISRSKP